MRYERHEITLQAAERFVKAALEADDLDEGFPNTLGDRSVFSGPEPAVEHYCDNAQAEGGVIATWVQELGAEHAIASHEICVAP